MAGNTLWSTSNGDVPVSETGMALLQSQDAAAAQAALGASELGSTLIEAADVAAAQTALEVLPAPEGAVPAYSTVAADLAAALVRAGLMQEET